MVRRWFWEIWLLEVGSEGQSLLIHCGHTFAIKEFKHFVWCTVPIDIADVSVDMGKSINKPFSSFFFTF